MQLSLLKPDRRPGLPAGRQALDRESERLLREFKERRLADGAHPQSVKREVSQLRAVERECGSMDQPAVLRTLLADVGAIARALREPRVTIARTTGRARFLAVQRFIRIMGPQLGRDPAADLEALDRQLPAIRSTGWHVVGTLVAGTTGRRRRRGPTLGAADLHRIVEAAAESARVELRERDRALVALQCFSGLRAGEIVRLRWDDLMAELTETGFYGLTAAVERNGRRLRLPLAEPVADAIRALRRATDDPEESRFGWVFHAHTAPNRPLSYRAARVVLDRACRRAGLPRLDSVSLRAACAHWLRSQGLSDHEVASVLGLAKVRSVDRLLKHHAALDAQRAVREIIDR
jgi:integrase